MKLTSVDKVHTRTPFQDESLKFNKISDVIKARERVPNLEMANLGITTPQGPRI